MADESIKKLINQLLDADGNAMGFSSSIVIDPKTGKTLSSMLGDGSLGKTDEEINALIDANVESLRTAVNTFLSGEPDDNATMDRLKELVQAITENKTAIDALVDGNLDTLPGSIDIAASAEDTPTWNGKIRMIVSDYTPPAATPAE